VRGKVVSISDSELVVARRQYPFPYFRSRKEQVFAKDAVEGVDAVDSAWDGALLGMAAGAPFLIHSLLQGDDCGNQCGIELMIIGIPAVMGGRLITRHCPVVADTST